MLHNKYLSDFFSFLLTFSHGDVLYLKDCNHGRPGSSQTLDKTDNIQSVSNQEDVVESPEHVAEKEYTNVAEDEIDVLLSHESGLIHRKKHPQL